MTRPTVLITGAGSGIGRALAQEAARRGYVPILAGRRPEPLEETALTLPVEARIVVADILTRAGRAALTAAAGDRLDVLINNAGTVEVGPLASQEDAALTRLIETNLTAPILLTRDLLPALRRAKGRVVNVGSVFGDIAYPYFAAYSASKFGLRGFSDALRREVSGEGVGVTYAAPRATRTSASVAFGHLVEPLQMTLDPPEAAAARIWDAVGRGEREAYPRGKERLFVLVQRLFPRLVDASVGAHACHPRTLAALAAAAAE
jgi:short-subunit dehydrogenase